MEININESIKIILTFSLLSCCLYICKTCHFICQSAGRGYSRRDDIFLYSTREGLLHAYNSSTNSFQWTISLGKPLILTNIEAKNILFEEANLLPSEDGVIYLINTSEEPQVLDTSIQSLIEKSPFTLSLMNNQLFVGESTSTIFTLDPIKGEIYSKIRANITEFRRKVKSITDETSAIFVLRTDHTLKSLNTKTNSVNWNLTISEISMYHPMLKEEKRYEDYINHYFDLTSDIEKALRGFRQLKNVIEIHKYIKHSNLPLKMDKEQLINAEALGKKKETRNTSNKNKHDALTATASYWVMIFFLSFLSLVAFAFGVKTFRANKKLTATIKYLKNEKEIPSDNLSLLSTKSLFEEVENKSICIAILTRHGYAIDRLEEKNSEEENSVKSKDQSKKDYDPAISKDSEMSSVDDDAALKDNLKIISKENSPKKTTPEQNYITGMHHIDNAQYFHTKIFELSEINRQELQILSKAFLTRDDESKSFLLDNNQSITEKYSQLYKIINEVPDESCDAGRYNVEETLQPSWQMCDTGRFMKNFTEVSVLGRGGFGSVFKAMHKIDERQYAVKVIKLRISADENLSELEEVKEVKTMMRLEHKKIVRYFTCWFELENSTSIIQSRLRPAEVHDESSKNFTIEYRSDTGVDNLPDHSTSKKIDSYDDMSIQFVQDSQNENKLLKEDNAIVSGNEECSELTSNKKYHPNPPKVKFPVYFFMQMEYCEGFPLSYYLENRASDAYKDKSLIIYIFNQILVAVNHIHSHNIIHRDLKPSNIFIHGSFKVKVGDFGLAADVNKYAKKELKEIVGTPLYQSPEQLEGKNYNQKVDVYSVGLILLELCSHFKTQSQRRFTMENIREMRYPDSLENESPNELRLIKMMTHTDPEKRPRIEEVMTREYCFSLDESYD